MAAIIGTNIKVEVQQTLSGALTPTGTVSKANPGVVSYTGHGLTDEDVIVWSVSGGMVELDGQACRINFIDANSFGLEGIDTTNYTTWTTGTFKEVTAFQTLSSAQSITMPNPAPNKIEVTTLLDKQRQYAYGLPEAPDGSITGLFNPGGTAEGLINAATNSNLPLVFRVTFGGVQKTIFNGNVSGGAGFDLGTNAAATATISFTPLRQVVHYAT